MADPLYLIVDQRKDPLYGLTVYYRGTDIEEARRVSAQKQAQGKRTKWIIKNG